MQGSRKGFWFETEGKALTLSGLVLGNKVWLWWLRQRWSEVRCGRGSEVVCGGKEGRRRRSEREKTNVMSEKTEKKKEHIDH